VTTPAHVSDADRAAAVDAYATGRERLIEIAAQHRVTSKTVLEWVRQAGRPVRTQPARDQSRPRIAYDPVRSAALAEYRSGASVTGIASRYAVPRTTVLAWLRAAEVPLRAVDLPSRDDAPGGLSADPTGQASAGQSAAAPTVTVECGRGEVTIAWSAPDGGVSGFAIEISQPGKKKWKAAGTVGSGTGSFTWRKGKRGKEYRARVCTLATAGTGPWSEPVAFIAR
jgi:transposase-like protein